jgi:hypothetical protein
MHVYAYLSIQLVGIEAFPGIFKWLWNLGFAAVVGDAISRKVFPTHNDEEEDENEVFWHEYLFAGCSIMI